MSESGEDGSFERNTIKRISEHSPESRDDRAAREHTEIQAFGEKALRLLQHPGLYRVRNRLGSAASDEQVQHQILDESRSELLELYRKTLNRRFIDLMFYEGSSIEDVAHEDKMSDDVYRKMLELHVQNVALKKAEFQNRVPGLKKAFADRMRQAARDGLVPKSTTALMQSRLRSTTVQLVDGVTAALDEAWGAWVPGEEKVILAEQAIGGMFAGWLPIRLSTDNASHVFSHEMLHAMSGRSTVARQWPVAQGEEFIDQQRTGLQFDATSGRSRFRWLNEAVTEDLTVKLVGEDKNVYRDERRLLQMLCTSGKTKIPDQLVREAYFENYEPGQGVPRWKEFAAEVDRAYQPGFLQELDRQTRTSGVNGALEWLGSRSTAAR